MRVPFVRLVVAVLAAVWAAAPAFGQTTLTSGNATFTLSETPTAGNMTAYAADFQPEGGATVDHLFAQWMYYKVAGDARSQPLGNYTKTGGGAVALAGTQTTANTMTYAVTESGTAGTRFTATWTLTLQDGARPGEATVLHSLTVTNPAAATSDLSLSLIHYLDYDLGGPLNYDGHSATGGLGGITITKGSIYGSYTPGTAATKYQVGPPASIDLALLNGEITELNNAGLPFEPGDWTGAYQWDLLVPAGGSRTIQFEMGVSPVPEPGAVLALAAAGLGLVGAGRRFTGRAEQLTSE